jgi:hypothetical protein
VLIKTKLGQTDRFKHLFEVVKQTISVRTCEYHEIHKSYQNLSLEYEYARVRDPTGRRSVAFFSSQTGIETPSFPHASVVLVCAHSEAQNATIPAPPPDRTGYFLRVMTRRYTRPEFGKFSRPSKQRHLRSVCVPEGGLLGRDSLTDRRGRRTKLDSARRGRCRDRARDRHIATGDTARRENCERTRISSTHTRTPRRTRV